MRIKASEEKFGIHKDVTEFGMKLAEKIAAITVEVFSDPTEKTQELMSVLINNFTDENRNKFSLQVMPGGGSFENYEDAGCDCGPSFDGRLRGETIAQDFSPQPYLMDQLPSNKTYEMREIL